MNERPRIIPVILCGGSGSRLWPLSHPARPKQFIKLGKHSLLQHTVLRTNEKECVFVTLDAQAAQLEKHLQRLEENHNHHILREPCARNTAAAIALAAQYVNKTFGPEALLWVLPSDHVIDNEAALHDALTRASGAAQQGQLVTFGMRPDRPETGYGYIEHESKEIAPSVFAVRRFTEKPDKAAAKRLIAKGALWNSGLFVFKASTVLEALNTHAPEIINGLDNYDTLPALPFDKAILEKAENVATVPCDIGWDDIGSWSRLSKALLKQLLRYLRP